MKGIQINSIFALKMQLIKIVFKGKKSCNKNSLELQNYLNLKTTPACNFLINISKRCKSLAFFLTRLQTLNSFVSPWLSPFADLQSIRRLLEHDASGSVCPSCRISFDKGKRRKLIDTCGHERCYSCMFRNDQCPMCMNSSLKGEYQYLYLSFSQYLLVLCSLYLFKSISFLGVPGIT